ncbi:HofO family protein [Klebsiella aerogenes]
MDGPAFSPLEPPVAGVALQAWQPRGRGGEMLAVVDWQAVPPLFAWLADCGVHPGAFSLNAEKGALQLSLQLERDDET